MKLFYCEVILCFLIIENVICEFNNTGLVDEGRAVFFGRPVQRPNSGSILFSTNGGPPRRTPPSRIPSIVSTNVRPINRPIPFGMIFTTTTRGPNRRTFSVPTTTQASVIQPVFAIALAADETETSTLPTTLPDCSSVFANISNSITSSSTSFDETIQNIIESELNFYLIDSTFQSTYIENEIDQRCRAQFGLLQSAENAHTNFLQCMQQITTIKSQSVDSIVTKLNSLQNQFDSCQLTVSFIMQDVFRISKTFILFL